MAKIAALVPQEEMCSMISSAMMNYVNMTPISLEYIPQDRPDLAVTRAKELEKQGCDLILARGIQSRMIKRAVQIPVTEIQESVQELGVLILQMKKEFTEPGIRLGLVCLDNMVADVSRCGELFEVDLKTYFVNSAEELPGAVEAAFHDGCQAVIGGRTVCRRAEELNMKCCFLSAGMESIHAALSTAERICYAIDLEKRNVAEMDSMLNNTFSGIMQVNRDGRIHRVNTVACSLLRLQPEGILGRSVESVIPKLEKSIIEDALVNGEETNAMVLDIQNRAVVVNVAPVRVQEDIQGAILTFQEGSHIIRMNSELRRELYQRGYIAKYSFDSLIKESREMFELVRTGKRIAKFAVPVLLTGEDGSGKSVFAQCLHKESLFRMNAFIPVECSAWLPETLDGILFGNYSVRKDTPTSLVEQAQNGTLFLNDVESLMPETQYKLLNLIRGKYYHNGANTPSSANVRVIAATSCDLASRVEAGTFRRDLYYALNVLNLRIPPLREHRADILGWVDHYLAECQEKHKRYIHLTQGAWQYLQDYSWPGNLDQVSSICESMVLLTEKRNVDEVFLRKNLEQPATVPEDSEKSASVKDPRAAELARLLSKHGGNRAKVAAELGISKTTLWRYIKKYGIEPNYIE